MSKDYSFSVMPSVSISRSRFARNSQVKTTFDLGKLIVLKVEEVLPGDTHSVDVASLIRMSTPVAPIMDNIYLDLFAFFVPNRIVWDHWKEFMGENNASAGIPLSSYSIPYLSEMMGDNVGESCSYIDYFGLPVGVPLFNNSNNARPKVSALPFRGLAKIYNRWFRDENLIAPLAVQTGDANEVIVGEVMNYDYSIFAAKATSLLNVSKLPDYFTKALPYAQKGVAVKVPLGTTANVVAASTTHLTGGDVKLINSTVPTASYGYTSDSGVLGLNSSVVGSGTQYKVNQINLVADLSNATAATINQLRYAFQLQKLLEKDALYGTRYWEILAAHFGVTAPDASLQDPEYLGGKRININIDQVLATADTWDTSDDPASYVGKPGANSVTADKGSLFTKSFVEHGYIIIVACARHDLTYTQGIDRMWSRQGRYDFYWPVFANIGAQEIKNKEIYTQGTATDDATFGYQEAWAEYRYSVSKATGKLRPGVTGNKAFWTLAENFPSLPTLSQSFVEQDRSNIQRALITGSSGPDFIADFYFRDIAVRPMPVYSIPGLIDHH